jgi:protease-4
VRRTRPAGTHEGIGEMSDEESTASSRPSGARERVGEWERDILARLAFAAVAEQRRTRRWNTVFKLGLLLYLVALLLVSVQGDWFDLGPSGRHTALVELNGVIAPESDASADRMVSALRAAFDDEDTAGIIVRINSPGGSPVQAGYINDEIQRLRRKHPEIPLYAVIADVCASGGYYVAAAADRIFADKASVVGSIGVLMNGFGFVAAMDKLGVERRLLTAGDSKALLDPFSPLREQEVAHVRGLLDGIHAQFIDVVKRGRGERLGNDPQIFSGLIWTGEQGVKLGLVDELGSAGYVAREVIGAEEVVDFTPARPLLEAISERMGAAIGEALGARLGLGDLFRLR